MRAIAAIVTIALAVGAQACCRIGYAERPFTAVELEAERRAQQQRAGAGYESVVVAPFVVVASGPMAGAVRAEAAATVAWARDLLRADFFGREPVPDT